MLTARIHGTSSHDRMLRVCHLITLISTKRVPIRLHEMDAHGNLLMLFWG
jgi:hypothetical protein